MNKEVGFIWQGFFLLLVVLTGMGVVRLLTSMQGEFVVSGGECGTVAVASVEVTKHTEETRAGAQLFNDNCGACHKVNKDLTGPALEGIEERVKDKKLLYGWIKNIGAVLETGIRYFNELYVKWNKTPMSIFPTLTDKEIDQILAYIKAYKVALPIASN